MGKKEEESMSKLFVVLLGSALFVTSCASSGNPFAKKKSSPVENAQLAAMNNKRSSSNTPTGYIYREFTIRQLNLGGRWDDPTYTANFGFQHNYKYGSADKHEAALKEGILDDDLKSSLFATHYDKMKESCAEHAKATGALHVRAYQKNPQWTVLTEKAPPFNQTRELYFQCFAEGDRE
jgi:hypothetical protein